MYDISRFWCILVTFSLAVQAAGDIEDQTHSKLVCCLDYQEVTNENACQLRARNCDYDKSGPTMCPMNLGPPTCACKRGYLKNVCGFCVKEQDCNKPCMLPQPLNCMAPNEMLYGCHDASVNRLCPHLRKSYRCEENIGKSWSSSSSSSCSSSSSWSSSSCSDSKYNRRHKCSELKSDGLITLNVCDCKPGFYRNKCGQCVKLCQCKKRCKINLEDLCSDSNAVRKPCHKRSEILTCKHVRCGKKPHGLRQEKCEKYLCVCKDGFALNDCNQCVPIEQCFSKTPCKCTCPCQKPNEDWLCTNMCTNNTCDVYFQRTFMKCAQWCTYQCDCIDGLWRDDKGNCKPSKYCKKKQPIQL